LSRISLGNLPKEPKASFELESDAVVAAGASCTAFIDDGLLMSLYNSYPMSWLISRPGSSPGSASDAEIMLLGEEMWGREFSVRADRGNSGKFDSLLLGRRDEDRAAEEKSETIPGDGMSAEGD